MDTVELDLSDLEDVLERHGAPGAGVCVVRDGAASRIETAGLRRADSAEKIARADLFFIGSCAKFMTTCLAEIAVRETRLEWHTTLARLGESLDVRVHPELADVTLDQLTTCTSGFPEDREPGGWPRGVLESIRELDDDPRAGRRLLAEARLGSADDVVADGAFRYSNLGYCLAGALIEDAFDRPFEELMREKFFAPLGMRSAGFGSPVWARGDDQPSGHVDGRPVSSRETSDDSLALGPAGIVHMSLEDMGRYLSFVLGSPRLLPPDALARLLRPPAGSEFARGWLTFEAPWARGTSYLVTGSNGRFFTMFVAVPALGFAMAVSVNCNGKPAVKTAQEVMDRAEARLRAAS